LLARAQCEARAIIEHIVETGQFSELSDIDIALEGLGSVENYVAILGEAMRMRRKGNR
jgi:hypothetical protein